MEKLEILSDADKSRIMKPIVREVVRDVSMATQAAAGVFYGGYSPIAYHRTWGLKNPYHVDVSPTDKGYLVEFTYSPSYMSGHHASDEGAFESSFISGYHGSPGFWAKLKKDAPRTLPSPWEYITEYMDTHYLT